MLTHRSPTAVRRTALFGLALLPVAFSLATGCTGKRPAAPVAAAPAPMVQGPVSVFGTLSTHEAAAPRPAALVPLRQHTFLADGADSDVSLDPTGQWLLYTSTRHSPRPKIYLQRTDGVTVTQLTSDDADDANPVFSPDGKCIAFASNRSGKWSIYTMDIEGRNVVQVTNTAGGRTNDIHPSFSPDGTQLAYASMSRGDTWEIWTVDLTTGAKRMVGEGLFPSWSPEKGVNRIAFQKPRKQGTWLYSIWTMDLHDGEPRRLTEIAASPNAALVTPAWSPDGKRLTFATITNTATGPQHDLWVIDADGQNRRRLTDGVGTALAPVFAASNRVFFISNRAGAESIWSVNAAPMDGGVVAALPESPAAGGGQAGEHGAPVAEKPEGGEKPAANEVPAAAEAAGPSTTNQHATTETP